MRLVCFEIKTMKTKSILILLISVLLFSCPTCTKKANKQKPLWITWWKYDSIGNTVHSVAHLNKQGEWEAKNWVGLPETITIPEGRRFYISSTNVIVNGDILGKGKIEFANSKSTLVVQGIIDNNITIENPEKGNIIFDKPLSNNDGVLPNDKYIVDVPCDWKLPLTRTENGVIWVYTEYYVIKKELTP